MTEQLAACGPSPCAATVAALSAVQACRTEDARTAGKSQGSHRTRPGKCCQLSRTFNKVLVSVATYLGRFIKFW